MTDDLDTPPTDVDTSDVSDVVVDHRDVTTPAPETDVEFGLEDEPLRGSETLAARAWHRAVRRPSEWAARPWPTERIIRYVVTVVSLSVTTAIMMKVGHLNPLRPGTDLIFDDTTPTGGDFGAHVWGPAFLRDNLLGSFRLNGWTMDWYSGMPAYRSSTPCCRTAWR